MPLFPALGGRGRPISQREILLLHDQILAWTALKIKICRLFCFGFNGFSIRFSVLLITTSPSPAQSNAGQFNAIQVMEKERKREKDDSFFPLLQLSVNSSPLPIFGKQKTLQQTQQDDKRPDVVAQACDSYIQRLRQEDSLVSMRPCL